MRIERPQVPCPKCGWETAFNNVNPRYRKDMYSYILIKEWLAWTCNWCGYELETKVLHDDPR